jgi:protein TonB
MFADSLLASAWTNRSHRGWTTLASLAVQTLAVGLLLLLPLLYTQALPELKFISTLLVPPAPPPGPRPAQLRPRSNSPVGSNMIENRLIVPAEIPNRVAQITENSVPERSSAPPGLGIPGRTGDSPGSVLNSIANSLAPPMPAPSVVRPPRVSHMMEGNLVHKVQPEYPAMARAARVQGTVVLRAIIGKDGRITNLRLLSGHPMLVKAAIDAVSQWRYRPYYLNGEPVEVETQVTVNFVFAGD